MRNFGAASLKAGTKYINDNSRYYNQFLPSLEKKFRSQGRGSFADVVKAYRGLLAVTGSESQARAAFKGKKALPPSSNEFVLTFQKYMDIFNDSAVALNAAVLLYYKQTVGEEAKRYISGGGWMSAVPAEEGASEGEVGGGGKSFFQQMQSRNVVGQGAEGTTVSDTDDLYDMEETSFFDQYKWPILGGTVVLLATGAYFFLRK
jgi:hypothetical protein